MYLKVLYYIHFQVYIFNHGLRLSEKQYIQLSVKNALGKEQKQGGCDSE